MRVQPEGEARWEAERQHRLATYASWRGMRQRCSNPNATGWHRYGGRGIRVCDRWAVYACFQEDMGYRPDGTSIDRWPDPDGHYEPGNCRWATRRQQEANKSKHCKPMIRLRDRLGRYDSRAPDLAE